MGVSPSGFEYLYLCNSQSIVFLEEHLRRDRRRNTRGKKATSRRNIDGVFLDSGMLLGLKCIFGLPDPPSLCCRILLKGP